MSIVADIRVLRALTVVSSDDGRALRIRNQNFKLLPVETGDSIDFDAYEDRLAAAQLADAYEAALSYLDFSAKTRAEIQKNLLAKGYVPACVRAVLERLEASGLIDDSALASRYVENAATKPVGLYQLKRKLRAKGVSDEDAEEALSLLDEEQQTQAARAAAEKLLRRYSSLPARESRGKLSQALARRGFSWDSISGALEELFSDFEEE